MLALIRKGKTNREIAGDLGIANGTVSRHIHNLLSRFDVPNRTRPVNVVDQVLAHQA